MEGNSSSALKDMLKSPSPPKPVLARVKPVLIMRKRRSSWFSGTQPEKMEFSPRQSLPWNCLIKVCVTVISTTRKTTPLVLEEIRIPHGDILRANRSGGRLRLAFVISDGESSDMEEEEEINENAG
ncbi:hypothetical protein OIU74_021491 [Salix koriyanagi]|uniref:FAF domain-containing protein n=1 Tax=Salix koriyanagi TaxID=2511006 RepID=A0A9Q0WIR0_9ROSI|nr:hypothetical protein OIU74_021491 [Salix koriyanagi]